MRVRRCLTGCVATALGVLAVTAAPSSSAQDFYEAPQAITQAPGSVLKAEPSSFYLDPLKVLKASADVQRFMYVSTGTGGVKKAVTGTMLTPRGAWLGKGERPLVSYAVGTQGMADRCAPSRQLAAGSEYEGLFIKGLLARGYSVVVTDYDGLGTAGKHAYALSDVLGRNVLDAARAATRLPSGAASASAPVFVAGYSEGGNAAAGALEQASTYAPDVNVKAGYAGAVPADLTRVADNLDGSLYAAFLLYAVNALDANYPSLALGQVFNAKGHQALAAADNSCTVDGLAAAAFTKSKNLTVDGKSVGSYLSRPDIAVALEGVRLGKGKPDVPVLVAHSSLDDVVPYAQGRDMARSWCKNGANVSFAASITPTHVGAAITSYAKAFAFFEARVAGLKATSNCGWF